jgi:hypothetical protein
MTLTRAEMSTISVHAPLPISLRQAARYWCAHLPRRVKLIAAAAMLLVAADQLWIALQSPAQAIRDDLVAAAAETDALAWTTPPAEVRLDVSRHLSGYAVRVDAARFPVEVSVALAGIDRATCLEARRHARRIEGTVVVALDGYGSATDCRAQNEMTWRIMP